MSEVKKVHYIVKRADGAWTPEEATAFTDLMIQRRLKFAPPDERVETPEGKIEFRGGAFRFCIWDDLAEAEAFAHELSMRTGSAWIAEETGPPSNISIK